MMVNENLIQEAFERLYPGQLFRYNSVLNYGGLKKYNANIRLNRVTNSLQINMSRKWKDIDEEIQLGLIQELLIRMLGKKFGKVKTTTNIDLYNNFIKNLHLVVEKTRIEPELKQSFGRVNDRYFYSFLDMPNLVWGPKNLRTLGTYDYQTDTVKISGIFKGENERVIDYIMYHELLHKKHKFKSSYGRNYSHTAQFKKKEKEFENAEDMESLIHIIVKRNRIMVDLPRKRQIRQGSQDSQRKGFFGWLRT